MADKHDPVGVVDDEAIDMVDGLVVRHPDHTDKWIVAKPLEDDA